jgi:integrase
VRERSRFVVRRLPDHLDAVEIPRSGTALYRDPRSRGLFFRVSNRGYSWVLNARIGGMPRRVKLGDYPRMSLDAARTAAGRLADRGVVGPPTTLAQAREQYLGSVEFSALAPRTQSSYRHVLTHKLLAQLMGRKLRELTRQDFLGLKHTLAQNGLVAANKLRPLMALCSWALDHGLIETNPATRLKLQANEADPQPYTQPEVSSMLAAIEKLEEPTRTLGIMVTYTGQRPTTWASAKWSEADLRRGTLTVVRSRGRAGKLGRGWSIPIPRQALEILTALRAAQGRHANEWVFGRRLVVQQRVRDRMAKIAGLADASNRGTLHRFRATFLTKLTEWGVPLEMQLALAGHASPLVGSRAHYVAPAPTPEQVAVMQRYGDWIQECYVLW